jgi:hypothetical protein
MIKQGYYGIKSYPHTADQEKQMFADTLNDLHKEFNRVIAGVEIGVLNGETSRALLNINPEIWLVGIDPLIPDSMEASLIGNEAKIRENTQEFGWRFKFIHDYSQNVHHLFESKSVDFLFIDGDHTYNGVKQDFELYYDKVRKGGLIYFHDSRMYRGGAPFHVGSSRFTDELINAGKMRLLAEAFSLTCFKKTE